MRGNDMDAYELYRLRWMIDHGWSLTDVVEGVFETYREAEGALTVEEAFAEWEYSRGFPGGEI